VLTIVNPAAARLLGSGALEGQDAIASLPPALANLIANWQAVGENLSAVVEMPWTDNTVQMVSLTPIPETRPDQWGWVAVVRDITHIKRMEEVKSQVLVEVASRIRIPIAQAMNALVELNLLTAQNKRVNEVVARLSQIWKHIQEWGDDLNALIRIDSGMTLQAEPVDLESILNEVCQGQAGAQLQNAGAHLEKYIEPNLPRVMADPDLTRRLLSGLITRAIERSHPGASVRLIARYYQQQVWVNVSDDGPSVDDADLAHIFEKSFARNGNGSSVTGLEMALVKTIIDRMGGQVWVGGQERKGSAIFVCLPTLEEEPASQ
jgi:signal transduction histidine kinase